LLLTDINECTLPDNNVCDQICTDTAGHFTCSCRPGYKLSPDKMSCEGMLHSQMQPSIESSTTTVHTTTEKNYTK
jgi:hypothetical protein